MKEINLINPHLIGKSHQHLTSCDSTNALLVASLSADNPPQEGHLISTSQQTAGKGQRGNQWESEAGKNLTFSFLLCPNFLEAQQQFELNKIISVGIAEYLHPLLGDGFRLKWPNDLYYNSPVGWRKLGGILIENQVKGIHIQKAVVGIGLNVNQTDFEEHLALSLYSIKGKTFALDTLLQALISSIEQVYILYRERQLPAEVLHQLYVRHLLGTEKVVQFQETATQLHFKGIIVGVSPFGGLMVKHAESGKTKEYHLKEIQFSL